MSILFLSVQPYALPVSFWSIHTVSLTFVDWSFAMGKYLSCRLSVAFWPADRKHVWTSNTRQTEKKRVQAGRRWWASEMGGWNRLTIFIYLFINNFAAFCSSPLVCLRFLSYFYCVCVCVYKTQKIMRTKSKVDLLPFLCISTFLFVCFWY